MSNRLKVEVIATANHPYRKEGEKFPLHPEMAKVLKGRGFIIFPGEQTDHPVTGDILPRAIKIIKPQAVKGETEDKPKRGRPKKNG